MNKLFVWLVRLAAPLWTALGADPKAIALILAAKLKMDDRGGFVMGQQQKPKKGQEYLTYFFLTIFGVFVMALFRLTDDPATAVGLGFSLWVCYIGLLLITEMSENLFDQRDLYVLLSRPISDLTLSLARILHIAVFVSKFALCLGVPTFIYLLVTTGVYSALVYFLCSLVAIVVIMTGTLAGYLLLLRRVPSHRVKKIVGYFQIVATLLFFTAYQLPSLLGDIKVLESLVLVDRPAGFLFPGLWLGGLYKVLTFGGAGPLAYAQAGVALVAAAVGTWYYLRQSRGYADRLLSLRLAGSAEDPAATAARKTTRGGGRSPVRDFLARWLTAENQERVSFRFHWNVMLRDMTFKQRVYPGLVYLPIVVFLTVFKDVIRGEEALEIGSGTVLLLLYFVMWVVIIPLGQTKISEFYRSSWIFEATANPYPQRIAYGQIMAVLGMFFLPTIAVLYPVVLLYFGWDYAPDILLAMGVSLLFTVVYNSVDAAHPFSRSKDDTKFQAFLPFLLVSTVGSLFGFGHYAMRDLPLLVPGAIVVVWAAVFGAFYWMRTVTRRQLAAEQPI